MAIPTDTSVGGNSFEEPDQSTEGRAGARQVPRKGGKDAPNVPRTREQIPDGEARGGAWDPDVTSRPTVRTRADVLPKTHVRQYDGGKYALPKDYVSPEVAPPVSRTYTPPTNPANDPLPYLNERAQAFSPATIANSPITVASMVGSSMSSEALGALAPHIDDAFRWLVEQESAADGTAPGLGIALREQALNSSDPAVATKMVDYFLTLSADERVAFIAEMDAQGDQGGIVENVLSPIGTGMSAYLGVAKYVFSAAPALVSDGLDALGHDEAANVTDVLSFDKQVEVANDTIAYGGRAVQVVPAAGVSVWNETQGKEVHWKNLIPRWGPEEDDPLTVAIFDFHEYDINDPAHASLRVGLNLTNQFWSTAVLTWGVGKVARLPKVPLGEGGIMTPRGWAESRWSNRPFRNISRTMGDLPADEAAVALIEGSPKPINAFLARELAQANEAAGRGAPGIAAMKKAWADWVEEIPTPERVNLVTKALRRIDREIDEAVEAGDDLLADTLQTDKIILQKRAQILSEWEPVTEFPNTNPYRSVVMNGEGSPTMTLVDHVLSGRLEKLRVWMDDLPFESTIKSNWAPERSSGWLRDNFETLGKFMRRAGVPSRTVRARLGSYFDTVTNEQEFFEWMKGISDDIKASLEAKGELSPEQIRDVTRVFSEGQTTGSSASSVTTTVTDDLGRVRVTDHGPVTGSRGQDLPSQPDELMTEFKLTNLNKAVEANKAWNRFQAKYGAAGKTLAVSRWTARTFTTLAKPVVLTTRIVPIFLKTELDQMLRNIINGYAPLNLRRRFIASQRELAGVEFVSTGSRELDVFKKAIIGMRRQGLALLPGGIMGDQVKLGFWFRRYNMPHGRLPADAYGSMFDNTLSNAAETIRVKTPSVVNRTVNKKVAARVGRGIYTDLTHLSDNWLPRLVAKYGPEEALMRIRAGRITESQAREWQQLEALWGREGVSAEVGLLGKEEQIVQVTMGDPEIRAALHTRKIRTGEAKTSKAVQDEIDLAQGEMRLAKEAADDASRNGDIATAQEFVKRKRALDKKIAKLKQGDNREFVHLDDDRAVIDHILTRHEAGELELPPTFPKEIPKGQLTAEGTVEANRTFLEKYTDVVYRAYRVVGKSDIALARGSPMFAEYNHMYARLRRMGLSEASAHERALARASFQTKDIHYDLAARTTVQNAVKNLFWFAPAWQEGLVSWLYKLPLKLGGGNLPLGYALGAANIQNAWELAKWAGFMRTVQNPDGSERKVVSIPNPLALLDPDAERLVDMDLEALNIVARGAPGLSNPIAQIGLEAAAEAHGGALEDLNNLINAYGFRIPGADVATKAYEAMFHEAPPWAIGESRRYQEYIVANAHATALRFAIYEASKDGIEPPNPSDFDKEREYEEAREAYWAEIDGRAEEKVSALTMTSFLGSVVGPTTYTPQQEGYREWKEFLERNNLVGKERTPADWALINRYLAKHPQSIPFNVSVYDSDASKWPKDEGFEAFSDALTSGDIVVLSYEDFRAKMALQQQWAYFNVEKNRALDAAGLGGYDKMTVRQQLLHAGEYNEATREAWDDFEVFLKHNPEARRQFNQHRSQASRIYDRVQQIELERDALILDGKDPDKMISKLYDRGEDAKYGTSKEERIEWFKGRVMGDYYDGLTKYYSRLDQLSASDAPDAAAKKAVVYDHIRDYLNGFEKQVIGGHKFPLPEEYAFYKKDPDEQARQRVEWALLPPAYLSNFQYETVYGKKAGDKVNAYLDFERGVLNQFYAGTAKLSSSSLEYAAWEKWRDTNLDSGARQLGVPAVNFRNLEKQPPGARLYNTGLMPHDEPFYYIAQQTTIIAARITNKGYSIRGTSEYANQQRGMLAGYIDMMREPQSPYYSAAVDDYWDNLALAYAVNNDGRIPSDHQLYRETLFGAPESFDIDYSEENQAARSV